MKHTEPDPSEAGIRYKTLFDQSPDGVLIIDTDGRILEFNETAHRELGYSKEEFSTLRLSDIDASESPEEITASIRDVLSQGRAEFDVRHRRKNGEMRDVHVITQVLVLSGQTVFHTIWRDVTARRRVERDLESFRDQIAERGAFLQQIMDTASVGIGLVDKSGRFTHANRRMAEMFGCTKEELIGSAYMERVHPSEREVSRRRMFELLESAMTSAEIERRYLRKDGSEFWGHLSCRRFHDARGKELGIIGAITDITESRRARAALMMREKQLAESQRIAHIGSWEHNLKTGEVFWSDELFRLFGLDPEKDRADFKAFFEMVHPDDQPLLRNAIDEALKDKRPFNIDYRFLTRDGTTRIIHAQAELVCDDSGDPVILSGTGQDVTERKHAEERILHSEQFIRNILDTVDEGFIVIDRDFRILTANKAYCRQVGAVSDEIRGRHCYEISHKTDRPCYEDGEECAVSRVFETGEPQSAVHRHTDSKGNTLFVETRAFPLKDISGAVTTVIETVNNITDKHLLEEQILRTQKLEAVGLLAGGIAHDFNNLLQGVFGNISMVKMFSSKDSGSYQMLEEAERALNLARNLTRQLLTFSKGGEPLKRVISLTQIIKDAVKFSLSGSNVGYTFAVDDNLWSVEADGGQISQVINNIVLNASDAMPEGGTVRIAVRNVSMDGKGVLPLKKGKYVMIAIEDSGVGIPQNYISKIFDPYFTTKQKGSGLGLATSYSIVKKHGGILNVFSEPGKGSTFFVYLPASEKKLPAENVEKKVLLSGRGRVLVMDDEQIIRLVTGQMLKTLGYEAIFAETGEEAYVKYNDALKSGRPFDAVILDLTVRGGMGGLETIRKLRQIDPSVKAIVSSGYTEDPTVSNYHAEGFRARLSKPYELAELSDALDRTINAAKH